MSEVNTKVAFRVYRDGKYIFVGLTEMTDRELSLIDITDRETEMVIQREQSRRYALNPKILVNNMPVFNTDIEMTPEIEAEYQAEIDRIKANAAQEAMENLKALEGEIAKNSSQNTDSDGIITTEETTPTTGLYAVDGLGKASVAKLIASGVTDTAHLQRLLETQAGKDRVKQAIGGLVFSKLITTWQQEKSPNADTSSEQQLQA